MHLEFPHESFMEDTMLSKDYENMAAEGITVTLSGRLSSMTTDHRIRPGHTGRTEPSGWKGKGVGRG